MRFAPIPDNESIRLAAVRAAVCSYAPREERFDRITRTAKRLFETPIALITIVEEDEQWFRSVQGLDVPHTPTRHFILWSCGGILFAAGDSRCSDRP